MTHDQVGALTNAFTFIFAIRSSSSGHHQSSKEGGSRKASRAEAAATNGIGDDPAASSEAASARPVDPLGSQFFCPALNCYQKLRMEDVLVHAQVTKSAIKRVRLL